MGYKIGMPVEYIKHTKMNVKVYASLNPISMVVPLYSLFKSFCLSFFVFGASGRSLFLLMFLEQPLS